MFLRKHRRNSLAAGLYGVGSGNLWGGGQGDAASGELFAGGTRRQEADVAGVPIDLQDPGRLGRSDIYYIPDSPDEMAFSQLHASRANFDFWIKLLRWIKWPNSDEPDG